MLELITKLKFNAVTTFALQTKFANIIFICALQERSETPSNQAFDGIKLLQY